MIFRLKMYMKKYILWNSMKVLAKINVFEARRDSLGAQNRPEEGPRGEKNDSEEAKRK